MTSPSDAMQLRGDAGRLPRGLSPALLVVVLIAAAWTILPTIRGAPRDPGLDDGVYLRFMGTVSTQGVGSLPALFRSWNADARNWIYPSPLRVGFIVTSALWAEGFGASVVPAPTPISLIGLGAAGLLGRRRRSR